MEALTNRMVVWVRQSAKCYGMGQREIVGVQTHSIGRQMLKVRNSKNYFESHSSLVGQSEVVLRFSGGTFGCDGRNRSTTVTLRCSRKVEERTVEELPVGCEYNIVLDGPFYCPFR